MKTGKASGAQIAFFTFALLLLIVPVSYFVRGLYPWGSAEWRLVERGLPLLAAGAVLFGVPALRRRCMDELSRPIPADRKAEVWVVTVANVSLAFAWIGLWILWGWHSLGAPGAEHSLQSLPAHETRMAAETAWSGWAFNIVLAGILAPVLEELTFRAFLYRAWERQWGWIPSLLLSSAVFAFYHPNFIPAFACAVLYTCLYRRTGALWAPIAAHAFFNVSTCYPLLGQFVLQAHHRPSADPGSWGLQLACLLLVLIALPVYAWMSRDAKVVGSAHHGEARAALPS